MSRLAAGYEVLLTQTTVIIETRPFLIITILKQGEHFGQNFRNSYFEKGDVSVQVENRETLQ